MLLIPAVGPPATNSVKQLPFYRTGLTILGTPAPNRDLAEGSTPAWVRALWVAGLSLSEGGRPPIPSHPIASRGLTGAENDSRHRYGITDD